MPLAGIKPLRDLAELVEIRACLNDALAEGRDPLASEKLCQDRASQDSLNAIQQVYEEGFLTAYARNVAHRAGNACRPLTVTEEGNVAQTSMEAALTVVERHLTDALAPKMPPTEQTTATPLTRERARDVSERAAILTERLADMLDDARREKNIMQANCVNRKLNEVNANARNIEQRDRAMRDAETSGDENRASHERMVLTVLSQKLEQLDQEATQCLGQSVYEPGASQVVTTIAAGNPTAASGFPFDQSTGSAPFPWETPKAGLQRLTTPLPKSCGSVRLSLRDLKQDARVREAYHHFESAARDSSLVYSAYRLRGRGFALVSAVEQVNPDGESMARLPSGVVLTRLPVITEVSTNWWERYFGRREAWFRFFILIFGERGDVVPDPTLAFGLGRALQLQYGMQDAADVLDDEPANGLLAYAHMYEFHMRSEHQEPTFECLNAVTIRRHMELAGLASLIVQEEVAMRSDAR